MAGFLSTFKNGGPNYSYGRVFSGFAMGLGLLMLGVAFVQDVIRPATPVVVQRFDIATKTAYTETVLIAKPDWVGYSTWASGLLLLAGGIYGIGRAGEAANKAADAINRPNDGGAPSNS